MKLSFWKRETVSRADHEAAMAKLAEANVDLEADLRANHASTMAVERTRYEQELGIERDTVARLNAINRALKEENATLRAEAEANKVDAEELERWRRYGQMRDPATGRLIPRVKAEVA